MSVTPVARITCLVVLAVGIATAPLGSGPSRAALAVIVLVLLLITRPRWSWLARRLGPALLALGALLVPLALSVDPERALVIALRAVGATLASACIASTIPLRDLGPALVAVGTPRSLASAVHTLLWQIDHVGAEGRRLMLARRLRGAERFGPEVLSQLLVRTAARAERVDLAMRLRSADGAPDASRFGVAGAVACATALAAVVALHGMPR